MMMRLFIRLFILWTLPFWLIRVLVNIAGCLLGVWCWQHVAETWTRGLSMIGYFFWHARPPFKDEPGWEWLGEYRLEREN